jgi:UTP:GlnB (protein PII) uridylyltransferase
VNCVSYATGASRSKVTVTTTDRPGLLMDIVKNLKDLSLNVVSAEIDTVGPKVGSVSDSNSVLTHSLKALWFQPLSL